jgi:hypothetical protein
VDQQHSSELLHREEYEDRVLDHVMEPLVHELQQVLLLDALNVNR